MTAPYHLAQIFVRDSFSEMFILIAIPLIILGLLYLKEKRYKLFFLYFVGGYTLTYEKTPIMKIANIISIVTFILCIMLLIKKKRKKLLALCEKM